MTLSNSEPSNEPPGKPPAASHGSAQPNPTNVDDPTPSLFGKVEPLKEAATIILERTPWPEKHAALTQQLLDSIKSIPDLRNLPESAALSSPDLRKHVEQAVRVLEDVRERLESTSSKYRVKKKGFFGSIKGFFSSSSKPRSSEVLRSCQEDVEEVLAPLRIDLESGLRARDDVGPSSQIAQDTHPPSSAATPGVKPRHDPTGAEGRPTKQAGNTQDPIANPTPMDTSPSNASNQDDVEPSSQIPPNIHLLLSGATPGVEPQDNHLGNEGTPAKETGTARNSIANPTPLDVSTSSPGNQDDVEMSSQVPPNVHPLLSEATPGVAPQDNPTGTQGTPTMQTDTAQNSTAHPPPPEMSASSPSFEKKKRSVSAGVLNAAGKIFTAVDTVSGLIPIVGSYVGAAAKVGSAVVEMVQKMDENEEIAKNLEKRASKLSDLIECFKEQSARTGGKTFKAQINELERFAVLICFRADMLAANISPSEISDIQKQVDEWKSTGKLKKAFSATDDSDALAASVKAVETSLAEMQALVSLNITDLLDQLYTHNLLSRLGDGDYGTQSKSSDNATCLAGTRADILDRIDAW
ncbi:hypothetical protein FRC00_008007, partial [Tulasnella sp. 408]